MKLWFLFLLLLAQGSAFAQTLSVEYFSPKVSDVSARTKTRLDNNGKECALIKVLSNQKNLFFSEAIGNVENQTNEYWVYVSGETKKLTVKSGQVTHVVDVSEYGMTNLESKTTYEMKLSVVAPRKSFSYKSIPSDFTGLAEKGDKEAECNLGKCYYLGQGIAQNYYTALNWFRKSADKNWAEAQYYIGRCYYYSQGFPNPDYLQAVLWLEKAAKQDFAEAQYHLGICYEKGQGVKQSSEIARQWYEKAANNGHSKAKMKIQ